MKARQDEPERAAGTARYGVRWRARDAARTARFRLARASVAEVMGTCWICAGPFLFAVSWASGPLDAGAYVPGPVLFLAGAALVAVARIWGRRR